MNHESTCCPDFDPDSMQLDQARSRILEQCRPLSASQWQPLRQALGRVLAEDVVAPIDVPPSINSAMDGYAIRHADLAADGDTRLRLVGRSLAGHPCSIKVGAGEAVRITTGAVMPDGADTIIMQEDCRIEADQVRISGHHHKAQHLRYPGDDIQRGTQVLGAGRLIRAADLGLLASLGIRQVKVTRPVRVAFFSTGDELSPVGSELAPGQIYDSNRYTLYAMLTEAGCEAMDLGVARDQPDALEAILRRAAESADMVITTGGVSVGDADYVKEVLDRLGAVSFWKIAMKPGRPLTFGHVGEALFFGLPGNPVSVMATFYQLTLPALRRLQGREDAQALTLRIPCTNRLRKRPGRIEFQRGVLRHADGELKVECATQQDSHILSSMSRADCFIVLPAESQGAEAGELVEVQLFTTR